MRGHLIFYNHYHLYSWMLETGDAKLKLRRGLKAVLVHDTTPRP